MAIINVLEVNHSKPWQCNLKKQTCQSYLCYHLATFARSYLGEELKNQDFCYIPREVSNIPEVRVRETKAIR